MRIKRREKNRIFLAFVLITVVIVFAVIITSFRSIDRKLSENYSPALVQKIEHDAQIEILFNDELQGHIFSTNLIKLIRESKEKIIGAIYSIDSIEIRDELYQASARGVQIDLILDYKKRDSTAKLFKSPPPGFNIIEVNKTTVNEGYMHNKFLITDPDSDNAKLLTGSWNWTILQELIDPCYVMITQEQDIINLFKQEANILAKGFSGKDKFNQEPFQPYAGELSYNNGKVEVWFSPGIKQNTTNQRLIDLINSATSSIKVVTWQITDYDVGNALVDKAKNGVFVSVLVDDRNIALKDSAIPKMQERIKNEGITNIEIIDDSKRNVMINTDSDPSNDLNSFLHQHTLIVDDSIVAFGTNNWSANAAYDNDENMIVSDIDYVVQAFIKSYDNNREMIK